MPNVSLLGHHHTCPKVEPGPVPHVGGPIISGQSACTVNGKPVAFIGSATAHGGVVVEGDPALTVG